MRPARATRMAPQHTPELCAGKPALFRYFIEQARHQVGSVYVRCLYEVMRYLDDDHPEWDAEEREFVTAWRSQPKWGSYRAR
jgi:hypothetical protein